MKKILIFTSIVLGTLNSYSAILGARVGTSATVRSASIDPSGTNLLLTVSYGGGCGQHEFELKIGMCFETMPVKCGAELLHRTNDNCEALLTRTIEIPLAKYNLHDPYFQGGSLTIFGAPDFMTGEKSRASVQLP